MQVGDGDADAVELRDGDVRPAEVVLRARGDPADQCKCLVKAPRPDPAHERPGVPVPATVDHGELACVLWAAAKCGSSHWRNRGSGTAPTTRSTSSPPRNRTRSGM